MRIGTKSVLFGAHCFIIHPWFVAFSWWKLYGFPLDPRLWVAFFVHDLGYFGKPNMDGPEGEEHPFWGAFLMGVFFGKKWYEFTLYHSRFLSKQLGGKPSRLCVADKLAIGLTPAWLYLPMVRATGEIKEYMKLSGLREAAGEGSKYASMQLSVKNEREWYQNLQDYIKKWVEEHKDGREDSWTPDTRKAINSSGVYQ